LSNLGSKALFHRFERPKLQAQETQRKIWPSFQLASYSIFPNRGTITHTLNLQKKKSEGVKVFREITEIGFQAI
jgi:hypothetical protein